MSRVIVGYSFEKKNPPWPVIVAAAVILAMLLLWYVLSGQNQPSAKKVNPKPTVTTSTTITATINSGTIKMLTAKRMEDHRVKDFATDFAPGEKVYCFTSVALDALSQEIYHEWIGPDGARYAVVELRIPSPVADTWSYISLPPGSQGRWTVRTIINQKEAGKTMFRVKSE